MCLLPQSLVVFHWCFYMLYAVAKLQFRIHQFIKYNSMKVIVAALLFAYFVGVHARHQSVELSVSLPVPHTYVYMVVVVRGALCL